MIIDSGERRKFDTGAVRDIGEGKGRCDLLPLDVVSSLLSDNLILAHIDRFIRNGDNFELVNCLKQFTKDLSTDLPSLIIEVSKHYEDGARKYTERNWEKGIPLHCYIDSATRHYLKWLRGDKDEPHDRAFTWNILGALWTVSHFPDMNDLPFNREGMNDDKHSLSELGTSDNC